MKITTKTPPPAPSIDSPLAESMKTLVPFSGKVNAQRCHPLNVEMNVEHPRGEFAQKFVEALGMEEADRICRTLIKTINATLAVDPVADKHEIRKLEKNLGVYVVLAEDGEEVLGFALRTFGQGGGMNYARRIILDDSLDIISDNAQLTRGKA